MQFHESQPRIRILDYGLKDCQVCQRLEKTKYQMEESRKINTFWSEEGRLQLNLRSHLLRSCAQKRITKNVLNSAEILNRPIMRLTNNSPANTLARATPENHVYKNVLRGFSFKEMIIKPDNIRVAPASNNL
jgi:hypothetical protein